ncbi:hypothetical protein U471_19360 [Bacillus amyloliquefaciens CC178]|nr:hypothetical protein U471_19360 [Bacillus amyloliquefaciens CC178]
MNLLHLSNCFIQDHKISKKTLHEGIWDRQNKARYNIY